MQSQCNKNIGNKIKNADLKHSDEERREKRRNRWGAEGGRDKSERERKIGTHGRWGVRQ